PLPMRNRFNLSRFALQHPWLTINFWIALSVAGLLAFSTLKYGLFPEVTFPVVIVNATAPLTSVKTTESQLTNPLEERLQNLPQLTLYSSTYSGRSLITAAFDAGLNLEDSRAKVKAALQNIKLPEGSKFEVFPFNLNESPAITYALVPDPKIEPDLESLEIIVREKIIPVLKDLPGVLRINLLGDGEIRPPTNPNQTVSNPPTLTRWQSQDVLAIQVIKKASANTLEVVKKVEETVAQLAPKLTPHRLVLAETQADYIKEATNATIESLLGAIALAVLVIYPFLRSWRATFIAAIAIPLSLLGTTLVMAIFGFNLETLTLLALALVIGIVVDDAIVDVENISRHIDAGESPKQAALQATEEIGLTVTGTTLSIVLVFIPIALMGGTLGQFFKPFAITVAASVIFSLLVARTLAPVLAVFWLRPKS
ncbi:MAG: efflux RND transporter permease subunit, partial [Microcystaceae cyanobacterium]